MPPSAVPGTQLAPFAKVISVIGPVALASAGLYYLLVDRGQTKRTVNALTRRIAVSVALIALVIVSIYMGWIKPHGIGG